VGWTAEERAQDMTVLFDQTIPKPFCSSGPYDYVYVTGNVNLSQTTILTEDGRFQMSFQAQGQLNVQPVNPISGEPVGDPMTAIVREHHFAQLGDGYANAASWLFQQLQPMSDPAAGRLFRRLAVGQPGTEAFRETESCATAALVSIN
jgi:hypothetical protein